MKTLFVAFLAVVAVRAYIVPENEVLLRSGKVGSSIDVLIKQALEKFRTMMEQTDPFPVPQLPTIEINDDLVNIKLVLTDGTISKATGFVLDELNTDLLNLKSHFKATLPTLEVAGQYTGSGTIEGKNVNGNGHNQVDVTNLVVVGDLEFSLDNHEVQATNLVVSYDLGGVEIDIEGLHVDGMTDDQVKEFINTKIKDLLLNQRDLVATRVAAQVVSHANVLLKGKSLEDVIALLKKFINS